MFLFKQKTSYEMRISGWSSDVCSSDLGIGDAVEGRPGHRRIRIVPRRQKVARVARAGLQRDHDVEALLREIYVMCLGSLHALFGDRPHGVLEVDLFPDRSEEHTSELQSLMRISYAVFCLKKQNTTIQQLITLILSHIHIIHHVL